VTWSRPEYDLDRPDDVDRLLARDRPSLVVHAAAWTDVDGCAREPQRAWLRNATAVGVLAHACLRFGCDLVLVSTNEVFDGRRTDGRGYSETDETNPLNPYGASKLEGERLASEAFASADEAGRLWIVRTAWLVGPGHPDFPHKILHAAERLPGRDPLRVVDDEIGSPTLATDLAAGIMELTARARAGVYHLVNLGAVSRFTWAQRVLARCRPSARVEPISSREFTRASIPPAWAVLDTEKSASAGVAMRPWDVAFDSYVPELCT
jgi:dTDP-4-dehydrorhamnose reductase